jgi:hypothetical protein
VGIYLRTIAAVTLGMATACKIVSVDDCADCFRRLPDIFVGGGRAGDGRPHGPIPATKKPPSWIGKRPVVVAKWWPGGGDETDFVTKTA